MSSWAPDASTHWTPFVGGFTTELIGGMAVDASGNIYACGRVIGPLDGQPYGGGILVKLSPTGQKLWTRQWGADRDDGCNQLGINSAGVILAAGYSDGVDSRALARFDANGNRLSLQARRSRPALLRLAGGALRYDP